MLKFKCTTSKPGARQCFTLSVKSFTGKSSILSFAVKDFEDMSDILPMVLEELLDPLGISNYS